MVTAVRIHAQGGPEVMQIEDVALPDPGTGEVVIEHSAIGLNYIDVYHRTGLYPLPLPNGLGLEGAGTVTAVGDGVTDLAVGDRVAYASPPIGAYATARVMPADRLVKLPDGIDFDQAAAMMLQGMTVEYLLYRVYPVQRGSTLLMHAAAGGVGLILTQWAKALGATVIGTVGSEEKADLARAHGCDHVILYKSQDVASAVKTITDGRGVDVVYDGVGKDTYTASLDSLRPRGMFASFGQSSGTIAPVPMSDLASRGSLFMTRPSLMDYTKSRADLVLSADRLFDVVTSGKVEIPVKQRFALTDIRAAHEALEARQTVGSTILTV